MSQFNDRALCKFGRHNVWQVGKTCYLPSQGNSNMPAPSGCQMCPPPCVSIGTNKPTPCTWDAPALGAAGKFCQRSRDAEVFIKTSTNGFFSQSGVFPHTGYFSWVPWVLGLAHLSDYSCRVLSSWSNI